MLRILEVRTGEPVPAAPARRGLTRVEAHAGGLDPTALRVLLTADLLARALEIDGTPVWTVLTTPHAHAELGTTTRALGIRPFEETRAVASGPGSAQVVHVMEEGEAERAPAGGAVVGVAPVTWARDAGESEAFDGAGLRSLLADPTALRLVLLARPRNVPVRLEAAALDEAARELGRWRGAVARWAREPSRPVPEGVRVRLREAWEDDLDVARVLEVLRDVARDAELTDGARFETYVYADRLLALELARDLGSLA